MLWVATYPFPVYNSHCLFPFHDFSPKRTLELHPPSVTPHGKLLFRVWEALWWAYNCGADLLLFCFSHPTCFWVQLALNYCVIFNYVIWLRWVLDTYTNPAVPVSMNIRWFLLEFCQTYSPPPRFELVLCSRMDQNHAAGVMTTSVPKHNSALHLTFKPCVWYPFLPSTHYSIPSLSLQINFYILFSFPANMVSVLLPVVTSLFVAATFFFSLSKTCVFH